MQYSVSVNNIQGYETVQQNDCQGQIKAKEIKTCLITIDDSTKPLSIPSSQYIGGADQSATAQPPAPLPPHKLKEEELMAVQEEVQATFFLALHSTLQQLVTLEIILTLMKTWQQTIQRLF